MASQQGGPSARAPHDHDAREASPSADAILDAPYSSDEEPSPHGLSCRWRTSEFYDQECCRYFDCPSHLVERRLSVDDTGEPSLPRESVVEVAEARQGSISPRTSIEDEHPVPDHDGTTAEPQQRDDETLIADTSAPLSSLSSGLAAEREAVSATRAASAANPTALPARTSSLPIRTRVPSRSIDLQSSDPLGSDIWGESSDHGGRAFTASASATDLSGSSSPRMSARDQLSAVYGADTNEGSGLLQSLFGPPERERERERERTGSVVLPRWQPDAEVTYCPICRTQFSIFVRKHHCRKCGRVVCNSCSPHRIIIPHQFIVRAPGSEVPLPPALLYGSGASYVDMNGLSGGERVRLCNPCVPDPNTAPPQSPTSPALSPREARRRSRTSLGAGYPAPPPVNRYGGVFAAGQSNDPYQFYTSRTRSITMDPTGQRAGGASSSSSSSRRRSAHYEVASINRLMAAGPSPFSMPNQHHIHRRRLTGESGSSSRQRALPPPPQIAEEDECPICHLELPSRELPNFEALRESHITSCIQSHSTYGSPRGASDGAAPLPPPRRTGMYTYPATEKDCIDDAECTICLEEFTVGIPMARLECLCRFHRSCISAWFVNHPGRCPVHQHDGFGY
ncbi:FYVE zinc finger domain-containing protein [Trichoderma breve]|uniref:RING-type E3 ubiquitin transferase n=1 Tax=Trichoderma breve TaxID=2034170 RepID=A0A9W9E7D8_9HYPO|nr:FYVE zinc finger domain-containing protein [Trichoderma breve]KAJ4860824.1 FYVE zinc finger domain-containing protein [Trichoderma breve]